MREKKIKKEKTNEGEKVGHFLLTRLPAWSTGSFTLDKNKYSQLYYFFNFHLQVFVSVHLSLEKSDAAINMREVFRQPRAVGDQKACIIYLQKCSDFT